MSESVETKPKKMMHLNFFDTACTGGHMSTGQWKSPKDNSKTKDRLRYYMDIARLAEKGKISCIFFADSYSAADVYQSSNQETYRAGSQVAQLDPVTLVSAMASVTENVSFGITGSVSYIAPYQLARTWSSLDHLTEGRVAWNIVTSWSEAAAKAMGKEAGVLPREQRYEMAEEYMDIMYKLWEGSWEDDAVAWDEKTDTAYDAKKIHKVEHKGKYLNLSAPHQVHPSPQRTPVLFQAGTSKAGVSFAGRHAEAIYLAGFNIPILTKNVQEIRKAAAAQGRSQDSIKIMMGISPIIGRTMEEAQAKYEEARKHIDYEHGLAKFSGYTGIDMSKYPVDEPFKLTGDSRENAIQGVIQSFTTPEDTEPWTPRRMGEKMALGALAPVPVGTPEMIADDFERYMAEVDCDGFNIAYVSNPGSFEDVVELLRPELLKRGLVWEDYPAKGGTFRENLFSKPGQSLLPDEHPGRSYRWDWKKDEQNEKASKIANDEATELPSKPVDTTPVVAVSA